MIQGAGAAIQPKVRSLLLLLPGLAGAAGMFFLLGPDSLLKVVCGIVVAPYALGGYELYKGWAIRKTQRALLEYVPAALEAADRLVPRLLADGMTGEALRETLRDELRMMTSGKWGDAERDVHIEEIMNEVFKEFDARVLLDHAAVARKEGVELG